ncbi:MAG: hypothetical protein SGCHY_002524 [Lobulomycetales sp.]
MLGKRPLDPEPDAELQQESDAATGECAKAGTTTGGECARAAGPQKRAKINNTVSWSNIEVILPLDWQEVLAAEFKKPYFAKIKAKLLAQKTVIYPPLENVFEFSRCPFKSCKVVILGQGFVFRFLTLPTDPYHGPDQAHGLCFSVIKTRPPPSLKNMFKELASDIPGFEIPDHGNLASWADQGVLLLNATLTVQAGKANSHVKFGWDKFTDAIIKKISSTCENVVFCLWGAFAAGKRHLISSKHLILQTAHPSPLSARRGFFGCKHFSKANEYLLQNGRGEIDWKL